MTRYFFLALARHVRSGRTLYVLTVFGVALGVASVLSMQIINRNALAAFAGSVTAVSGDADLTVLGYTPSFPENVYPRVLAMPGVRAAWPLVRVDVALSTQPDVFLEVLGIDMLATRNLPWQGDPGDLGVALGTPGWMAVTPTLAAQMGWQVGTTVRVAHGSRRVALVVGASIDFQALSPLANARLVVMDIAQVQSLFGRAGEIHQIDLKLADRATRHAVQSRLQDHLGEGFQVVTASERQQQAEGLLSAFRLNLTAMSLISLFVGMFLVYSSVQASLVRRRDEFGLLRSLGATRLQVFVLIFSEVAILGSLGVALGLPLGYAVAQANVETVSATLTNLYLLEEITRLEMTWWLYALGIGIGVGGALAGALVPALDMSRRDPRALLSDFTLHERVGSLAPRLFAAAFLLMALSGLWYAMFGQRWKPAGFVLGMALLFALPLLVPFFLQQLCGRVRLRGFKLAYSLKGLAARLQTTAFAVASLAVAVSMLIGITLMVGSFRRTLETWIGTSIQADVYVTSLSWRGRQSESGLSPDVLAALTRHASVRAADRLRGFLGYAGTQRVRISGVQMDLVDGMSRFPLLHGDAATAYRLVQTSDAVFIGETLARKMDIWTGDRLSLHTPSGVKSFAVAAVYYDYSTEGGAVVMDLETMTRIFGPGPVNSVALYLYPQHDPDAVADQLKAMLPQAPLTFTSNRRLRAEVMQLFDQTFAVTGLLQLMSLLIAVCGIALMLLVLAREQIPELALYRSIGATRRQLFGLFVGKGLGMGLAGLGLGFVGGVCLAAILIYMINRTYFGWTIQPYMAWGPIAQQAVTILGAAVLASLYPALRASRTPATELSRDAL